MKSAEIAELLNGQSLSKVQELFRKNPSYLDYSADFMADERMRVRLAATSILEDLSAVIPEQIAPVVFLLIPLLQHPNHLVRGDAANLIAILDGKNRKEILKAMEDDPDPQVREVIRDILQDLGV